MAWFEEAVFYHIYPLGLTGAPKQNAYSEPEHRLNTLIPWVDHIKEIGCNALYIGPLFESVGHGYETTDYKKLDSRLGTNDDLIAFVQYCHNQGMKVIFDGVFNHTGRDFFAFKDIQANRENSPYRDWYCNVNFYGNNEYNDGFSYDNWGGYNLLVKLNQRNPAVQNYICDVIRYWVEEFDVDGIRLDAADVLDFDFMKVLRQTANTVKKDFYLMGEVIHGEYNRWVNHDMLHAVTNYTLHKALYSGHNDHNYFEVAHTVKRLYGMGGNQTAGLRLYNFVDNHDVERIYSKVSNKAHLMPIYTLMYTLPGVPSIYYGSEYGIAGEKHRGGSDDAIRPELHIEDYSDALQTNSLTALIARLGQIRQNSLALSYGEYQELLLTNRQYIFARTGNNAGTAIVAVNNDDQDYSARVSSCGVDAYVGMLSGQKITSENGQLNFTIKANSGEIWVPENENITIESIADGYAFSGNEIAPADPANESETEQTVSISQETETTKEESLLQTAATDSKEPVVVKSEPIAEESAPSQKKSEDEIYEAAQGKSYEQMTVEELQACILHKMAQNGPVNDQMRRDVMENIWHDSLVNWIKSFR